MTLIGYFMLLVILLLNACSTTPSLIDTPVDSLYEEHEFVLTPEVPGISAAAVPRIPKLIVRLSIKPELDTNGQRTGRRYGQAAFFWTDKSRSNGGSNLGGTASIVLREANNPDATQHLSYTIGPVMTNLDLYSQTGYEDHLIKSHPVTSKNRLCVEVWSINLVSTNWYRLQEYMRFTESYDSEPVLAFCQPNTAKSGAELRLVNLTSWGYTNSGEIATLPIGIIQAGPRPAENVTVSITIADIGTPAVSDQSGLFDCTALAKPEIQGIHITCTALRPIIGFQTLPISLDAHFPYDLGGSAYLVESHIKTSTPEHDPNNNSLYSVVIYN